MPDAGVGWEPTDPSHFQFSVDGARARLRDETSEVVAAVVGNLARLVGKQPRDLTVSDVFDYYMIPAIDDVYCCLDITSCPGSPTPQHGRCSSLACFALAGVVDGHQFPNLRSTGPASRALVDTAKRCPGCGSHRKLTSVCGPTVPPPPTHPPPLHA